MTDKERGQVIDEKLRGKILQSIDLLFKKQNCGYSQYEMDVCIAQIEACIEEAGYKSPEEIQEALNKLTFELGGVAHEEEGKTATQKLREILRCFYFDAHFTSEGLTDGYLINKYLALVKKALPELAKEDGYMKETECQRKLEMLASELDKLASNACQAKIKEIMQEVRK